MAVPTGGPTLDRRTSAPERNEGNIDGRPKHRPSCRSSTGQTLPDAALGGSRPTPLSTCELAQDRSGVGLGVARQEADCVIFCGRLGLDGVPALVDNNVNAESGKSFPLDRKSSTVSIVRTAVPAEGLSSPSFGDPAGHP